MLLRGTTSNDFAMINPHSEAYVYTQHAKRWLERAYQCKVVVSGRESDGAVFFAQLLAQFHDS